MFLSVFLCLPIEAQEPDLRSADPGIEHGRKAMTAAEVKRQSEQAWRKAHENDSVCEREMASRAKRESLDSLRREILARKQLNGVVQKRANGPARASELPVLQERLDSIIDVNNETKTVYNYDDQNRLVSRIISSNLGIMTYEYDSNGYLIKKIGQRLYEKTELYLDYEYKYTYDSNGNETGEEYISYNRDGSSSSYYSYKKEYELDDQGNFLQLLTYQYIGPDEWMPKTKEEYTYYPNSLIKTERIYNGYVDDNIGFERGDGWDYEYDQENRVTHKLELKYGYDYRDDWYGISETWTKYDSESRKVFDKTVAYCRIEYISDWEHFDMQTYSEHLPYDGTWLEYEYDSKGRQTMSAYYDMKHYRGVWLGHKNQYEYYDNDVVKKSVSYVCEFSSSYSSNIDLYKRIETYDQKGNTLSVENYKTDLSEFNEVFGWLYVLEYIGEDISILFEDIDFYDFYEKNGATIDQYYYKYYEDPEDETLERFIYDLNNIYSIRWLLNYGYTYTYNESNDRIGEIKIISDSRNPYLTPSYSEYKLGFVYDKSGRLLEKNKYTRDSADSEFELTSWSKYEYNAEGKLELEIEQSYHDVYTDGEWTKELIDDYRREYIYEDNGNIFEKILPYGHSGRIDRVYDSMNNILSETNYSWNHSLEEWSLYYKYEYAYDDQKNQTMYSVYYWDTDYWEGFSKWEKTYDLTNGLETLRIDYVWDSAKKDWKYSTKKEHAYDEDNNEILYASYTWDNDYWKGGYSKYEYAYDASRNYKLRICYHWNTSKKDWEYYDKYEVAYHANGQESIYNSLYWSTYYQTWLGMKDEYDELGRLIVDEYTYTSYSGGYRYEYNYEGENTDYSSYKYYTYDNNTDKMTLYRYYEKIVDEYGDLHSEKTIRYKDEGEIVSSAVSYLYDQNVLGENVISATTYHKIISGMRTSDGVTAPINYYYTLVGNNSEELALFHDAVKDHGYATVKANAQHIIAVNIDNHGYANFPYGLYDLPNLVEISAKGNALADFSYDGTASARVTLSLQDQCVTSNLEFAATTLLNANPSQVHSMLKDNLPPIVQRSFSAHGMSEPCLDENKGYTMTCFRKDSSGKKEDVFTMQVNKNEVLWTPASSDNIYEFESGETLYITNNGINDGVNAGSHCSCIVTFENGDANFDGRVNIQDLQSVINYMVGDPNTIFCKNAGDAYHDGTINVQDIVCLVNTLLEAGYYSAPRENRAQRVGTNDSEIIVRGNDLVLVNNTDIAALDIKLTDDCQVEWCLPQGMTVAEEGNHIIAYSLNGDVIASGETVIAHVYGWPELEYANLCTKDAALVPCTLRGITTSIEGAINEENSESIYSIDGRKRTMQGAGVNIRKYENGTSKKTVHLK